MNSHQWTKKEMEVIKFCVEDGGIDLDKCEQIANYLHRPLASVQQKLYYMQSRMAESLEPTYLEEEYEAQMAAMETKVYGNPWSAKEEEIVREWLMDQYFGDYEEGFVLVANYLKRSVDEVKNKVLRIMKRPVHEEKLEKIKLDSEQKEIIFEGINEGFTSHQIAKYLRLHPKKVESEANKMGLLVR